MNRRSLLVLGWVLIFLLAGGAATAHAAIEFTAEEQAYLARSGPIRMCVDPDWAPFERIN